MKHSHCVELRTRERRDRFGEAAYFRSGKEDKRQAILSDCWGMASVEGTMGLTMVVGALERQPGMTL